MGETIGETKLTRVKAGKTNTKTNVKNGDNGKEFP